MPTKNELVKQNNELKNVVNKSLEDMAVFHARAEMETHKRIEVEKELNELKEFDFTNYQKTLDKLHNLVYKYRGLVWYARKPPYDLIQEKYEGTPQKIIDGCMKASLKYAKEFPKETDLLSTDEGDWHHGFNSGCLAAFRLVLTALDTSTEICEETGEKFSLGGLDNAMEEFPVLDT